MNRRGFLSTLLGLSTAAICPELLLDLLKPRKTMIVVPEWKPKQLSLYSTHKFYYRFNEGPWIPLEV